MWRYTNTDELIHGFKYIKKIKTGSGTRYFYSQAEINAYEALKNGIRKATAAAGPDVPFKPSSKADDYYKKSKEYYKKEFDTVDSVNKTYSKLKDKDTKRRTKAESDRKAGYDRLERREKMDLSKIKDHDPDAESKKKRIKKDYAKRKQNWEDHWDDEGNFHITTIKPKLERKKKKIKKKINNTKKAVNKELHTTHKKTGNATGPLYKKPNKRHTWG